MEEEVEKDVEEEIWQRVLEGGRRRQKNRRWRMEISEAGHCRLCLDRCKLFSMLQNCSKL